MSVVLTSLNCNPCTSSIHKSDLSILFAPCKLYMGSELYVHRSPVCVVAGVGKKVHQSEKQGSGLSVCRIDGKVLGGGPFGTYTL